MSNTSENADMPAMPIEFSGFGLYKPEAFGGLTKREEFAKTAMLGILSGKDDLKGNVESLTRWYNSSTKAVANLAVQYADALLKELEK